MGNLKSESDTQAVADSVRYDKRKGNKGEIK